jgi:hypothetical protein
MAESRVFCRGTEGTSVGTKQKKCLPGAGTFIALIMIVGARQPVPGAEIPDFDLEIGRLRKEIALVKLERERLREDIARDKNEHAAYRERTAARKTDYIAETDSVRRLAASVERQKDSIEAFTADLEVKQKNFDLLKERFRDHIVTACKKIMDGIGRCPPSLSRPLAAALAFLANDCTSKNIDNIEALQRFVQILRNLDDATLSIQTGQETSALPQIKGNASMLRIGAVFEAVVDEDAKNAAVWIGGDSAAGGWRAVSDAESVGSISRAIAVREGKSLPAFLPIPWGTQPDAKERTK